MQELCRALEGTPHYQYLESDACVAALEQERQQGSAAGGAAASAGAPAALAHAPAADPAHAPAADPAALLGSWCLPQDKAASGWQGLSDSECMARFRAGQAAAVAAVRAGSGSVLFKHVHKV